MRHLGYLNSGYTARLPDSGWMFDFAAVGTVAAWYDLRAKSTVSVSGGKVVALKDLSGHGNHLTAGGSGATYLPSWREGYPAIRSDGGSLRRTSLTQGSISQPYTIYWVGDFAASGENNRRWIWTGEGFVGTVSSSPGFGAGSNFSSGTPDGIYESPCVGWARFSGASSSLRIEPDGVAVASRDANVGTGGFTEIALLGTASNGALWTSGSVSLAVYFAGDIPTDNASGHAAILAHLRSAYDVTVAT